MSPIRSTTDSAACASQPLEPNSTEQRNESSAFKTASEAMWASIMDRMKSEMKAAASEEVTQATARRVSPSPSPKLSSHRSKTRTRQSFGMTESENENLSEDEAVAKGARRKCLTKCSPKQSRSTTKPKRADQTEDLIKRIKELEIRLSKAEASANSKSLANNKEAGAINVNVS